VSILRLCVIVIAAFSYVSILRLCVIVIAAFSYLSILRLCVIVIAAFLTLSFVFFALGEVNPLILFVLQDTFFYAASRVS